MLEPRRISSTRVGTLLLVLGFLAATTSHAQDIPYRGSQVSDKKIGLTVTPVKEFNAVAVSSIHHRYFVLLPYTKEWRFESTDGNPLTGSDGSYGVTIYAVAGQLPSPSAYLEGLMTQLSASSEVTFRDPVILEERGRPILRYQARLAAGNVPPDTWQWNYRTIASDGPYNIALHLSIMDSDFNPGDQEKKLLTLLSSLRADFNSTP